MSPAFLTWAVIGLIPLGLALRPLRPFSNRPDRAGGPRPDHQGPTR
jgi:hypothetical protein